MDIISALSGMIVFCGAGFCLGLEIGRRQVRHIESAPIFADRHNDETGECESVRIEPEMVQRLRDRVMKERSSEGIGTHD